MHLIVDDTNELALHDVRYVPSIKKSLLSDKWICMDIIQSLTKVHGSLSKALG